MLFSWGLILSAPALLSAATLVDLNFDGDGASDGDSLTSTTNSGTLGGSAIGTLSAVYDTSANGSLGAMTVTHADGYGSNGNIAFSKGVTTENTDWTVAFALRRDGSQGNFNRIWDTDMGISLMWAHDKIRVAATNWNIGDIDTEDGVWTHITMTYDHGSATAYGGHWMDLYVNGNYAGQAPVTTTLNLGAAQTFYLLGRGNGATDRTMSGAIDNFQIHDEVLAAEAIATLSDDALTLVPEPGNFALIVGVFGMSFVLLRRPRA